MLGRLYLAIGLGIATLCAGQFADKLDVAFEEIVTRKEAAALPHNLLAHIANVQATLCANINGHSPKAASKSASKDTMIADLEASVGECDTAFDELSAENANKMVQTPAGQLTHLAALVYIITHASEEYGQLGIYLRLNHLMPPTSDEPKGLL